MTVFGIDVGSPRLSFIQVAGPALVLLLAGCLGSADPPEHEAPQAPLQGPAQNRAPAAAIEASQTSGETPLEVTFTIVGSDLDGDNLTWFIDINGDHASEESGHELPGAYTHVFSTAGDYRVRATLTDGSNYTEAHTRVLAHAPAIEDHPLDPIIFTGAITGAWAGQYVPEPDLHRFPMKVVPNEIRAHIDVGATALDLDYVLRTPSGDWAAGEANPNEPTGTVRPKTESDLVVDDPRHLGQLGDWTLEVWAGGSVEGEYTVTISFE